MQTSDDLYLQALGTELGPLGSFGLEELYGSSVDAGDGLHVSLRASSHNILCASLELPDGLKQMLNEPSEGDMGTLLDMIEEYPPGDGAAVTQVTIKCSTKLPKAHANVTRPANPEPWSHSNPMLSPNFVPAPTPTSPANLFGAFGDILGTANLGSCTANSIGGNANHLASYTATSFGACSTANFLGACSTTGLLGLPLQMPGTTRPPSAELLATNLGATATRTGTPPATALWPLHPLNLDMLHHNQGASTPTLNAATSPAPASARSAAHNGASKDNQLNQHIMAQARNLPMNANVTTPSNPTAPTAGPATAAGTPGPTAATAAAPRPTNATSDHNLDALFIPTAQASPAAPTGGTTRAKTMRFTEPVGGEGRSSSSSSAATPRSRKRKHTSSPEADGDIDDERAAKQAKRMEKNRQSAARSRERRQLYTEHVEQKLDVAEDTIITMDRHASVAVAQLQRACALEGEALKAAVAGALAELAQLRSAAEGAAKGPPPSGAAAAEAACAGVAGSARKRKAEDVEEQPSAAKRRMA